MMEISIGMKQRLCPMVLLFSRCQLLSVEGLKGWEILVLLNQMATSLQRQQR